MMLHSQRDIPDSATWDDETGETFGEARARFASFGPALSAFEVSRLPADTEVWSFGYGDDPAAFDAITAGEVGAAAAEDGYPAVDGYWGPFALTLPDRNQGVCPEGHPCYLSGDVRTCGIVHDDGGDTLRWYYGKPLNAIPDGAIPPEPTAEPTCPDCGDSGDPTIPDGRCVNCRKYDEAEAAPNTLREATIDPDPLDVIADVIATTDGQTSYERAGAVLRALADAGIEVAPLAFGNPGDCRGGPLGPDPESDGRHYGNPHCIYCGEAD
jgi:hypothetical protein